MKRLALLISSLAVLAGLLVAVPQFASEKSAPVPSAKEGAPALAAMHPERDAASYRVPDPVPMGSQAALAQQWVDYQCHDAECSTKANVASSEVEARWLHGRGFPSPKDEELMLSMPIEQLRSMANQGDIAAQAVLGSREIAAGQVEKGLAQLHKAASKGSVYAAHKFAEAYATEGRIKDLTESMAYYRLAYLQGDWKAGTSLYSQFPNASSTELALADRRAMRLYGALMAIRVKNRQRISFGPRPFPDQG